MAVVLLSWIVKLERAVDELTLCEDGPSID